MKGIIKRIYLRAFLLILLTIPAFAQKQNDKDDVSITIRVNGEDKDLEEYFEEWGEEFGSKMEHIFTKDLHVDIDLDDDNLNIAIDDIANKAEELGKAIGEAVKEAVTHMNIQIDNLSREDLIDHNFEFDDTDVSDLIEDIEDRYHSKVRKIDRLSIKIREDYVKIKMNVLLENGKRIEKVRIINNN